MSGTAFWRDETVAIRVGGELVTQVRVDHRGAFTATITVPQDAPPPSFPTGVQVDGESSHQSAEAPFHT